MKKNQFNDELEQILIGALVANPGNIADVMKEIMPMHFHSQKWGNQ